MDSHKIFRRYFGVLLIVSTSGSEIVTPARNAQLTLCSCSLPGYPAATCHNTNGSDISRLVHGSDGALHGSGGRTEERVGIVGHMRTLNIGHSNYGQLSSGGSVTKSESENQ